MIKHTQKRTSLVLTVFAFPIVAAIFILSITGVATVLVNQKLSGQKVSLEKAVLSERDSRDEEDSKDTKEIKGTKNKVEVEDAEDENEIEDPEEVENEDEVENKPVTMPSGKKITVTEGEGYKITVHEANPNSKGLAATERIKVQLRKSLSENPAFLENIKEVQMELETSASTDSGIKYRAVATKSESLFGIFKISIPVKFSTDESGNIVKVEDQSIFQKILDALSF